MNYPHTLRAAGATLILACLSLSVSIGINAQELPDPTRFEASIQRFEEADRMIPPPANAIVLTGSSSIMYWNAEAPADLAPLTVIPRGFGGSVMNDLLHYLDRVVLTYKPRAVLIYEGDNDTGRNNIPNDVIMGHVEEGITRIHAELPEARIYLLAVKPSVARVAIWPTALALNSRYQALADANPLVTYIDVATPFLQADGTVMADIFVEDNLHLNEKGYDIWAATIREMLIAHEAKYE
jgi:lysophospholipase L1-like esterase